MSQVSSRQTLEKEVLRKKVLLMFLEEHLTQYEIAEKVQKTQGWVSRILKSCRQEYRQFNGDLLDKYQAMEIDKCNAAEAEAWKAHREAWKAWKKSIGVVKVTKRIAKAIRIPAKNPAPGSNEKGTPATETMSPEKMEIREETKVGNPLFLNLAIKAQERAEACAARRCRLLGYDGSGRATGEQPRKNDRPLIPSDMTNSQLMTEIFGFFKEFAAPTTPGNGNGDKDNGSHGPN